MKKVRWIAIKNENDRNIVLSVSVEPEDIREGTYNLKGGHVTKVKEGDGLEEKEEFQPEGFDSVLEKNGFDPVEVRVQIEESVRGIREGGIL